MVLLFVIHQPYPPLLAMPQRSTPHKKFLVIADVLDALDFLECAKGLLINKSEVTRDSLKSIDVSSGTYMEE